MQFSFRTLKTLSVFALSFSLLPSLAFAQSQRTDLVTDATDPNLVNAWGLTRSNGSPFDNGTGLSTLYNGAGQKQGLSIRSSNLALLFSFSLP
jgi:hypothetical protein